MNTTTLYIVEDELLITISLKNQLESFGYTILGTATRCENCLKDLQALKDQGREPEIVLMDIHIKGDCDGIETAKKISERFDCGIIFITGQSSQEVYRRSFTIKPFGYLLKPIDLEQTMMTIEIAAHQRVLELQNRRYQEQLVRMLEDRTREKEEVLGMYHAFLDNSIIGLTILQDERFVFTNGPASRIFGYTREEFLKFSMKEIIAMVHPDDRTQVIRMTREASQPQMGSTGEKIRVYRKNGDLVRVMTHIRLITYFGRPALHQSYLDLTILQ